MTERNHSATGFSIEGNERLGWVPEAVHGLEAAEYAAIHLRVPKSGNPWLDEMIAEANRRDLAANILQGLVSNPMHRKIYKGDSYLMNAEIYTEQSVEFADKLIEQLKTAK